MDEVRFVFRCLVVAGLILVVSQLKTKSGTIESDLQGALVNSSTASFVNHVVDGGVKAIRNLGVYVKETYQANKSESKKELSEFKNEALEQVADLKLSASRRINSDESQLKSKSEKNDPSIVPIEGEELVEEIE
jgi:hypothetical protein